MADRRAGRIRGLPDCPGVILQPHHSPGPSGSGFFPNGSAMRRAARIDDNQVEIVAALRQIGASVQALHSVGSGCPDLAAGYRGANYFLEVKDGSKPPSARSLTDDQKDWHRGWRGQVAVVRTVAEAFAAIGAVTS